MGVIIGGEPHRADYPPQCPKAGIHALVDIADTSEDAADAFFLGSAPTLGKHREERGWPTIIRDHFEALREPNGALLVGSAPEITDEIVGHSQALGGLDQVTLQMNLGALLHDRPMRAIEMLSEIRTSRAIS